MKKYKKLIAISLSIIAVILFILFDFIAIKTDYATNDGIKMKLTVTKLFIVAYVKAKATNESNESFVYSGASSCDENPIDIHMEKDYRGAYSEHKFGRQIKMCRTVISHTEIKPNKSIKTSRVYWKFKLANKPVKIVARLKQSMMLGSNYHSKKVRAQIELSR